MIYQAIHVTARCNSCGRYCKQAPGNTWSSPSRMIVRSGTCPISACCGAVIAQTAVYERIA